MFLGGSTYLEIPIGYPLVNIQKATETLELFIGKSTINGQFSIVNVGKTMSKPTHDWEW
jgi:hypothetical protein